VRVSNNLQTSLSQALFDRPPCKHNPSVCESRGCFYPREGHDCRAQ